MAGYPVKKYLVNRKYSININIPVVEITEVEVVLVPNQRR